MSTEFPRIPLTTQVLYLYIRDDKPEYDVELSFYSANKTHMGRVLLHVPNQYQQPEILTHSQPVTKNYHNFCNIFDKMDLHRNQ